MEHDPSIYGQSWAERYDEIHAGLDAPESTEPVVSLLAQLAGDGTALELGIETGRIALPLSQRGVEVHGIDASEAMVARLREKPGGAEIPVTIGDFELVDVEQRYSVIYVVFNTLFVLPTQAAQTNCFRNVARRLADDGVFVIEAFVPDPTRFTAGQSTRTGTVEHDRVSFDLERHDPVNQTVASSRIYITPDGVELFPISIRYAWPSELDLMAALAGMRLRSRWSDWNGGQFTAASRNHVSIYELE